MEDTILNGTIRIDEASQDDKKVTLKQGKDKYSFWMTKKDGGMTKAYEAWRELKPILGDALDIQYKEEDAEWTNPEGKDIKFKRRTILNLRMALDPTQVGNVAPSSNSRPSTTSQPVGDYVTKAEFEAKIQEMSQAFLKMATEVAKLKAKVDLN